MGFPIAKHTIISVRNAEHIRLTNELLFPDGRQRKLLTEQFIL